MFITASSSSSSAAASNSGADASEAYFDSVSGTETGAESVLPPNFLESDIVNSSEERVTPSLPPFSPVKVLSCVKVDIKLPAGYTFTPPISSLDDVDCLIGVESYGEKWWMAAMLEGRGFSCYSLGLRTKEEVKLSNLPLTKAIVRIVAYTKFLTLGSSKLRWNWERGEGELDVEGWEEARQRVGWRRAWEAVSGVIEGKENAHRENCNNEISKRRKVGD